MKTRFLSGSELVRLSKLELCNQFCSASSLSTIARNRLRVGVQYNGRRSYNEDDHAYIHGAIQALYIRTKCPISGTWQSRDSLLK